MYTKKKLSMWRYLPKLSLVSSTYGMLRPILVFPKKFCRKAAIQPIVRKIRYLNWSFVNEYIGDITISTQFIKNKQCYCRQISQNRLQYSHPIKLFKNIHRHSERMTFYFYMPVKTRHIMVYCYPYDVDMSWYNSTLHRTIFFNFLWDYWEGNLEDL